MAVQLWLLCLMPISTLSMLNFSWFSYLSLIVFCVKKLAWYKRTTNKSMMSVILTFHLRVLLLDGGWKMKFVFRSHFSDGMI